MKETSLSTPVLLNVDDNEGARYARTRLLQHAGFIVHDSGTGAGALRLVSEKHPDLVLLDVNLPDMNGIEVCRLIKSRDESSGVIVLQISASATSAPQATSALNTGADSYIIEPVDPDVLVATVRAFLRLRTTERALAKANQQLSEKNAELEELNHALRRSNEDLEHFAYIASHDLQEPLRNIATHLQLLDRISGDRFDASDRQLFTFASDSARQMTTLINDVLAYSQIGKEAPVLQDVSLDEVLSRALENLSGGIAEAAAAVFAEPLPVVAGDFVKLTQVFQNLIGNSIKYRSASCPPRVHITAQRDSAGDWLIAVQDNGIGIAESHLEKVFQPFKRLHGRQIPGTGIGLAICKRIVEHHGGRIWVESREGEGATFFFSLHPAAS